MSKKQKASSARTSATGASAFGGGFGGSTGGFGAAASKLSYLAEQPDIANLTDSNLVVIFRNLSKKDGTTKVKALEELQSYVGGLKEGHEEVGESFLNAWIKIYPRLAIDVDRRVRQLSHTNHGAILACSGKKAARYMHDCVGSWVSGCSEGDRVVSKAALDAFASVFPTEEKRDSINKVYQAPILEFVRDALLHETAKTLSDERTTNAEDADAKYFRLAASVLSVLRSLLEKLPQDGLQKQADLYQEILEAEAVWTLAESPDSGVRRSLLRLLPVAFDKMDSIVRPSLPKVFRALMSKRSVRSQAGSALEYSTVLSKLASEDPTLWSALGKEPTSAATRFADLIKHGSQGASASYWTNLSKLLVSMPQEALPSDAEQATKILSSVRTGITRKDEPRAHANDAWHCYNVILGHLLQNLSSADQDRVLSDMAFAVARQFLHPSSEDSPWTINARQPAPIVAELFQLPRMAETSSSKYPPMAERLIEQIQTSQPEQSASYSTSQESVIQAGARWFELQKSILATSAAAILTPLLQSTAHQILSASVDSLEMRDGKPYGAAGVLDQALRLVPDSLLQHEPTEQLLQNFVTRALPGLFESPSSQYLASILYAVRANAMFDPAFSATLDHLLDRSDYESKEEYMRRLLTYPGIPSSAITAAASKPDLQAYISRLIERAMQHKADWKNVAQYLTTSPPILSQKNVDTTLADLTSNLTLVDQAAGALSGLEVVSQANAALIRDYVKTDDGSELVQNLLSLLESQDEGLATRAASLNASIVSTAKGSQGSSQSATQSVIVDGLRNAGPHSLAVDTLVDFARKALAESKASSGDLQLEGLISFEPWSAALGSLLEGPLPLPLATSADLGSLILLVDSLEESSPGPPTLSFDKDGFSVALRIGMFTVAILEDHPPWSELSVANQAQLFRLLLLTSQSVNDALSLSGAGGIISSTGSHAENQAVEFVSDVNRLVASWQLQYQQDWASSLFIASEEDRSSANPIFGALKTLWDDSTTVTPKAWHNARAYARVVREVVAEGWRSDDSDLVETFRNIRQHNSIVHQVAYIAGFGQHLSRTDVLSKLYNVLIADITGIDVASKHDQALEQLILANLVLSEQDRPSMSPQRIIFAVKHIVPWLQEGGSSSHICIETYRLLDALLPAIKDVYGDHWSSVLGSIEQICVASSPTQRDVSSSTFLPHLQSALRLCSTLGKLARDEDGNEDLTEPWQDARAKLSSAFVRLIKRLAPFSDASNQPLRTFNELLGRQLATLPSRDLTDLGEIYPLVAAESQSISMTAFNLLHKRVPAQQEQISVDVALDKTDARLPDELLSLILEPLTLDSLANASFEREIPTHARAYLSSWLLLFDHFRNASDKVSADYTTHLKESDLLSSLLNFLSDFLGHSRGKPIDASKFDFTIYSFDVQDDPLKDMQWLLVHLYYLSLRRTPMLVKNWWMSCRSRAVVQNIESWTEKYISPTIISDALTTVSTWAATQDANADDALAVKTNPKTREVTLAKELDAQMLALGITLPPNYPLGLATCHSINRVAVEAKKWQTWIFNTQGVIAFSNNSIIEGIIAFRRNVNGALKGQTECAICYSIVGADKQLPTKRCGTCRNLFHGSCLYRWFKSSNSSSCPLCRNAFNYT